MLAQDGSNNRGRRARWPPCFRAFGRGRAIDPQTRLPEAHLYSWLSRVATLQEAEEEGRAPPAPVQGRGVAGTRPSTGAREGEGLVRPPPLPHRGPGGAGCCAALGRGRPARRVRARLADAAWPLHVVPGGPVVAGRRTWRCSRNARDISVNVGCCGTRIYGRGLHQEAATRLHRPPARGV